MNNKIKSVAYRILLIVAVIVLYIAEIPLDRYMMGVEGVGLGLNNTAIVVAIYTTGIPFVLVLLVVKIICSMLFTSSIWLGTILASVMSVATMIVLRRGLENKIGSVGISTSGALAYNMTVWVIAEKLIGNKILINNLPLVLVFSIVYGVIIGVLAGVIYKQITKVYQYGGKE